MVLELKEVTKRFGNFTAVDQLSLKIPEKEMFGFPRGKRRRENDHFPNDLGLLDPSGGSITWDGKPLIIPSVQSLGIYLRKEAYIRN